MKQIHYLLLLLPLLCSCHAKKQVVTEIVTVTKNDTVTIVRVDSIREATKATAITDLFDAEDITIEFFQPDTITSDRPTPKTIRIGSASAKKIEATASHERSETNATEVKVAETAENAQIEQNYNSETKALKFDWLSKLIGIVIGLIIGLILYKPIEAIFSWLKCKLIK